MEAYELNIKWWKLLRVKPSFLIVINKGKIKESNIIFKKYIK